MPVFKDANNREWRLSLDALLIRAVRSQCDGLDLADLDGKQFAALADDPCVLVDCLWVLCSKQAGDSGLTQEQFAGALAGDAIELATTALVEAIVDFFPQQKRQLVRVRAEKHNKARQFAMAQTLDKLNDPTLEAAMLGAMERRADEEMQSLLTRLNSATNTPASAESTPED